MNEHGDSSFEFDPHNGEQLAEAATRLANHLARGGSAFAFHGAPGISDGEMISAIDPTASETLLVPRLVGG